ncbi:MFS transporter [Paenibacillus sp. PK3_47]|uniref:MFS transporter n=1 Tax=Paenibacillus sp. PK3_47 TaxID=2072642 RepID=UPI00201E5FA1|nr:MFS transporter [Paenibacillus sp. PK3_47]UQZ34980.1 MFS transporter [Paenibacillus sp. PK3_47]
MNAPGAGASQQVNLSAVKVVICLGAFLSNLSAGMFNIALVDISADLHIPVASAQWVVSIYLLVISVLLPVMGRLGDMLGRRKVHNFGLFAFALGALGCALAPNAALLLGFRVIQGAGASMYQATNMALIVSVFPGEQRGRALGLMSTFVAAGSMAGPALGGFLIQWLSWESNFWLLAAVAGAVGLLAHLLIPQDTETAGGKLDLGRTAWFAVALSTLMIAVDLGGRTSFLSLPVLLLFTASAGTAAAYAAHARASGRRGRSAAVAAGPEPADAGTGWSKDNKTSAVSERGMFADSNFVMGIAITVITYMAAFAAQLALPAVLRLSGAEPAWIGLIMIGYPLALVVTAPLCGGIADRRGPSGILAAGLLLMSATLLALGFAAPALGAGAMFLPVLLLGCAMGMITSPNTSIVMGLAAKSRLGMVSSLLALSRNIGMMFGTAAGGLVIGGGAAGQGGMHRAVFLACAAGVAAACVWLLYSFRRSGKREGAGLRGSAR